MKFFIIALLFMATNAIAAPFLVCDRDTTANPPTEYHISSVAGDSIVPALTTGVYGFKTDIASAPVGTTIISVKACNTSTLWGTLCSVASTYPLVRPAVPLVPAQFIVAQ